MSHVMQNGLYKMRFWTPLNVGTGIMVLENGSIRGGDAIVACEGTYNLDEDGFSASIRIRRHSEGMTTVFGIDVMQLHLTGKFLGDKAQLSGHTDEAPGMRFRMEMERFVV